ncbi:hypothetical protein D6825_03565 [Candidatus Woesearchaeota archaeon]|nr:MAG: hypothetical protein D6825_03565 [Candidatus Woesearchaeota archaeon]
MPKSKKTPKKSKKKTARKKATEKPLNIDEINKLIIKLDAANHALENHNLNLAQVWLQEYIQALPKELTDKKIKKSIKEAMEERDFELLKAAIEADIERLSVLKIKNLRLKITSFS